MRVLFLFLFVTLFSHLFAQDKKVFVIKAGEDVNRVIPFSEVYSYPVFKVGRVHFRDGNISQGLLNYNNLSSEMDFISSDGDTIALADEPLVKMITIDTDTFQFANGYHKIVRSEPQFKIGKRDVFTTAKIERPGAFDQPVSAAIITYSGFSNANHVTKLIVKENITLVKETAYFFGNKNNEFLPASRKNLLKSYPKQEEKILTYLRDNEVNFRREEDLLKLFQFLQTN